MIVVIRENEERYHAALWNKPISGNNPRLFAFLAPGTVCFVLGSTRSKNAFKFEHFVVGDGHCGWVSADECEEL